MCGGGDGDDEDDGGGIEKVSTVLDLNDESND